jgi:hypothetical protein
MPAAENQHEFNIADASHRQSMEQMANASKNQGEAAVRAISLWPKIQSLLEPNEVERFGLNIQARATTAWATAKIYQAQSLDAAALAMGTTRQALLDELAALPPTFE